MTTNTNLVQIRDTSEHSIPIMLNRAHIEQVVLNRDTVIVTMTSDRKHLFPCSDPAEAERVFEAIASASTSIEVKSRMSAKG